ncbi:MAG: LPS-assembly protein LptD [Pseudomonadota bacterium]
MPSFTDISRLTVLAIAGLCLLVTATGLRADDISSCPLDFWVEKPKKPPRPAPGTPSTISADEVRAEGQEWVEFTGNVELRRGTERLTTEHLRYHKPTDTVEATGTVSFETAAKERFQTSSLKLRIEDEIGETGTARYSFGLIPARGEGRKIEFLGPGITRLHDVTYTTCPEGQDSWFLKARQLDIDKNEQLGRARGVRIDFMDVPIFYLPYMYFPIGNQRQSGALPPRIGHSSTFGSYLEIPYYLNLAPNYDDTFTPRYMTKRGLMLRNEFRYMTQNSEGSFSLEGLPRDQMANEERYAGYYHHQQKLDARWSTTIDLRGVSDKQYLADFGDHINITSQTHLPTNAELVYRGQRWIFTTRVLSFETIDTTIPVADKPYQRLPQLTLGLQPGGIKNGWQPHFDGEWVNFDRRNTTLTGLRTTARPALSYPLSKAWGHFIPKAGAHYTSYNLNNAPDPAPSLARGFASLDTGLAFVRDTSYWGRAYQQTLEPRLYYLYVPAKNQNHLPVFDTALADFNFDSLFRENRFTGGDRIGDANQLTLAVTSRFLDDRDGHERLRLSLGQIFYYADQTVSLPNGIGVDNRNDSDLVGDMILWLPSHWYMRLSAQYDPRSDRAQKESLTFQYQPDRRRIVNLGYRFVRDQVGQSDISVEWPIAGRWTARARTLYSFRDDRNLDSYLGAEYNACCWAARVYAYRRYDDTRGAVNGIHFEFQLAGLSKYGKVPESPLNQSLFSFPAPASAPKE